MMNPAMTVDDSEFRNASEHYKQLATFWTDILHLMSSKPGALASVGPMRGACGKLQEDYERDDRDE